MFTQNYINLIKTFFIGENHTVQNISNSTITLARDSVTAGNSAFISDAMRGQCGTISSSSSGMFFGSGTTPATKEDYTLEAPITDGLSITNEMNCDVFMKNEGVYEWATSFILINNTDTDINLSEMGVFSSVYANGSTKHCVMMERTVLKDPVVIPAGGLKLVEYVITFNQS